MTLQYYPEKQIDYSIQDLGACVLSVFSLEFLCSSSFERKKRKRSIPDCLHRKTCDSDMNFNCIRGAPEDGIWRRVFPFLERRNI